METLILDDNYIDSPNIEIIVDNYYWVPCIVNSVGEMFGKPSYSLTPVIPHPHNDIENGQPELHYHTDTRFFDGGALHYNNFMVWFVDYEQHLRPLYDKNRPLEYFRLQLRGNTVFYKTQVELISKSKLKHKCIVKGKCPHRGMDLSNVIPVDGVITCPLHSLRFNALTKQII
jgi:hypothetical protein